MIRFAPGALARRRPGASRIRASMAVAIGQPVATSSSMASSSESESEPSGLSRGPAARRRAAERLVAPSAVRPRTCSRLPRTVLISPLWASSRNGWASGQVGCVFVA